MPRAPKYCGKRDCYQLVTGVTYCSKHAKAWSGPRTASSKITGTRYWQQQITPAVLQRFNYQCQIRYEGICEGTATTVDKIKPASKRPDLAYDPENHQAACQPCNQHKNRKHDSR